MWKKLPGATPDRAALGTAVLPSSNNTQARGATSGAFGSSQRCAPSTIFLLDMGSRAGSLGATTERLASSPPALFSPLPDRFRIVPATSRRGRRSVLLMLLRRGERRRFPYPPVARWQSPLLAG